MKYLLATVAGVVLATAVTAADFRTEVAPVLSRAGCNQGACHGNQNGKGGFKLSLRGADPAFDFMALTRDHLARRADPLRPEGSLVLLKATAVIPHEGGRRFTAGSAEYTLLRDWIACGMIDSPKTAARPAKLEVAPANAFVADPNDRLQIRTTCAMSDGSRRDVTALCTFETTTDGIASVAADGTVKRVRYGETAVLVRYLHLQVAVPVAFVPARPGYHWPDGLRPRNDIDHHVFAKLQKLRVLPSESADDATFLRRVYLDTLGVLPTAAEARSFLADQQPDKRDRLIDALLHRPEFNDFWALKWCDLLRNEVRTLDPKGVRIFHQWIRQQFADRVPLNEFARAVVAGRGSNYTHPEANFYRAVREPYARSEAIAQVFLGTRLQCAKCHNHPFDRWTQDDYHQFAAFFARVKYRVFENRRTDTNDQHTFIGEQVIYQSRRGELNDPRNGAAVAPHFLGDDTQPNDDDRLAALADWIADPVNPYFARTQVNRIWFHLFGRGIVEPNDDFRLANPPANPELLAALSREMVNSRFDLRHVVGLILKSRTYQTASTPNETNREDEANFAKAMVQPLEAEQLLDALAKVLDAPVKFDGYPGELRAGQLPELPTVARRGREPDGLRFLKLFGKPDRQMSCECERTDDTTVVQAFQLMTGGLMQKLLSEPNNRIGRLITAGKSDAEIVEELYLAGLSRPPSEMERTKACQFIAKAKERRAALEDVTWGIVNSKEFLLRR